MCVWGGGWGDGLNGYKHLGLTYHWNSCVLHSCVCMDLKSFVDECAWTYVLVVHIQAQGSLG